MFCSEVLRVCLRLRVRWFVCEALQRRFRPQVNTTGSIIHCSIVRHQMADRRSVQTLSIRFEAHTVWILDAVMGWHRKSSAQAESGADRERCQRCSEPRLKVPIPSPKPRTPQVLNTQYSRDSMAEQLSGIAKRATRGCLES